MDLILFEELTIGIKVKDPDGDIGIVKECSDIHNVEVDYEVGGAGLYCLDKNCESYLPLYKI